MAHDETEANPSCSTRRIATQLQPNKASSRCGNTSTPRTRIHTFVVNVDLNTLLIVIDLNGFFSPNASRICVRDVSKVLHPTSGP